MKVLLANIAFSIDFSNFEEQIFPEVTLFDKNDKQINLSSYLKSENNKITILNFGRLGVRLVLMNYHH